MTEFAGWYTQRSGIGADLYSEILVAPPEYILEPEQIAEVHAYGNSILATVIDEERGQTVGGALRAALPEDVEAPFIFAKPFLDGRIKTDDMPEFTSSADVYDWAATCVRQGNSDKLRKLAGQSLIAYKNELAVEILAGKAAPEIDPDIWEAKPFVMDPQSMLQRFDDLQAARKLIRAEYRALKRGDSGQPQLLEGAKRAKLEVQLAKVNGLVADYIPRLGFAQDQAIRLGDRAQWLDISSRLHPSMQMALAGGRGRLYTSLDYLKNGMGSDVSGNPSPVAHRLWELASAPDAVETPEPVNARFTPEEVEKLRKFMVSPDEIAEMMAETLRRAGLLSEFSPEDTPGNPNRYYPERKTRAEDGKWQVVPHPSKDSFAVESEAGVYQVPRTSPQPLYHVLAVGGNHELEHVNQGESDGTIAQYDNLAELKGRGVSPLREGGANAQQRVGVLAMFGERATGKPRMTYAAAIEEIRAGNGPVSAAVTYFDYLREYYPKKPQKELALEAADRVARLMCAEGTNSQPMAYAEEWLFDDALRNVSPEVRARAIAVTCFRLADQVRLHRFGLLPLSSGEQRNLANILLEVAQPYVHRALASE